MFPVHEHSMAWCTYAFCAAASSLPSLSEGSPFSNCLHIQVRHLLHAAKEKVVCKVGSRVVAALHAITCRACRATACSRQESWHSGFQAQRPSEA